MEFQEVLQRDLVRKEKAIGKMREELVILRGPVSHMNTECSAFSCQTKASLMQYYLISSC